ncbi:MAG: cupredoxin domain-containing protein [Gaiellaceae bacterium]
MRKSMVLATMLVAALAAQSAVAATPTVKVSLKEFKVLPSTKSVKAGKVTFSAKNVGNVDHELVVIKTNVAPGKLPVKNDKASEKGLVGKIPELKPGKSGKVTLKLAKGKYVLLCNIAAHYQAGQYTAFSVK